MKKHEIKNIEQPNLYDKQFDYNKVPVIEFEDKTVPMNRPKEIWITDTTFRDGQQARPPYDADQIVMLYKFLNRLGGPQGVIRQSEFFLYSDKDKKAVEKVLELGYQFPEVTGWIRAKKEDFQLVKQFGLKETGILTSVSDYHIFLKLKSNREKIINDYLEVVDAALSEGIIPRCHFEDITRADFEGFVIPFSQILMERSRESGIPIKIRACDTMGFGLPFVNATLPRSVPKIFDALINEAGVPPHLLEWHGHNDFHKVLANGTIAWLYGCPAVNGTLFGWGERTGNSPVEALIMDYISLHGGEVPGIDTTVITEIARYFHDELGDHISENYPFVGKFFNTTRAGIHADGAIKDERIYNIFDTGKLLNRPLSVAITDKSGVAGIALWLNSHFNLKGDKQISKDNPGLKGVYEWIMEEYKHDRMSSISTPELILQAKMHMPSLFHSDLDSLKIHAQRLAIAAINKLLLKPELLTMDPAVIEPVLGQFIAHTAFAKLAYVVDIKGRKITRNITQAEDEDSYSVLESDFFDRDWFKAALEKKMAVVSKVYISKIVKELFITVSAPIVDADGKTLGVLGIDINFDNLIVLLPSVE